ncbi:MAG TPA: PAS domain S-box protein [Xanthobacteraceae bacterium]|nr:PAS domain S-box protein [Xanthobacteraceae bacterium]
MSLSTRLAAAIVILVLLTVATVGVLTYRTVEATVLPGELDRVDAHARALSIELRAYARGARADITAFRSAVALEGLIRAAVAGGIDPRDGRSEAQWRDGLAERFVAELGAKPAYLQFRVIGAADGGREILRVDRSGPGGSVRRVPDAELRPRGARDYFEQTMALRPGQIYVSRIDLNQHNGVVAEPHVPVFRVATPLQAPNGETFGILAINVDLGPLFASIRVAASGDRRIYVVDSKGNYLLHPDATREFGFELGHPYRWQDDLPELATALGSNLSGAALVHDASGARVGAAAATVRLADGPTATVIETVPYAALMAPALAVRHSTLIAAALAAACAIMVAVLLARSLTRPLTAMTKAVEGFGQGRAIAIPTAATGEIGVLARAFARMVAEVREKTTALKREMEEHRRTETALARHAERERLFSAVIEHSNDAVVTKTLDGTITAWNPAAERMFGYTAEEAIGRNIEMIVPEERRSEVREILAKVGRGARVEHFETVRIARDGRRLDVSLSISPVKSPHGDIIGAAKIARDITDRIRTHTALLKEIEERRQIFETSLDLILVTDRRGTFLNVSPSSLDVLGYRPEEMIGRSAVEFVHPDDLDNTRSEMRAARSGRLMRNFVCRYRHKDGRPVTLTWTGMWSEPVQKHFFSGRDMTGQMLAEESLRDSERLARGIVDTALDGFVQMDEHGVIVDWNPQATAIFGWSRGEALGRQVAELLVPQAHRARHAEGVARFLAIGEARILGRRLVIEALRRDGKEIKVELSVTALRRRNAWLFNGFMRDVTEKLAAEEQLRQAQKMETIGQLTGGIAHDFNNILTVITGTIEILEDGVSDDPALAEIAHMIDEAAVRGAELTQRLLAFARRQPLQPRTTDINVLIVDAAKLLRPTLGEQIEIESVFEDDAWPALVDPSQLTSALINLAINARDAMPDGGKLVLETGNVHLDESYARGHAEVHPGPYVMIAVSDTGHGIPSAIRDKVFDPFFTTKGVGKGTGLGLSMVYGFVKQSNGHIKIYSEEGHGTTIKIYLPRAGEQADAAAAAPTLAIEGGAETILVVEDDPLVRNYVAAQLGSLGYTTLTAANAAEALARIDDGEPFDLLFTDVIMPGSINGRQLADEASRRRPGVAVLFTSGYTENAIVHHGRLDPGVLLLAKPYRKSDLARMIRTALAARTAPAPAAATPEPLPNTAAE